MIRAPRLMSPLATRPVARQGRLSGWTVAAWFAVAFLIGMIVVPISHAEATTLTGVTTIELRGSAATSLSRQHVTVATRAPAQLASDGRILLPVAAGAVAKHSQVLQSGAIVLRRTSGGELRSVAINGLRLDLDAHPALSGVIGGKRLDVATLDLRRDEYTATPATSVIRIVTTRVSLTSAAAKAIARPLRIPSEAAGLFGVLGTTVGPPATAPNAGTTAPTSTGTTGTPSPTTTLPAGATPGAPVDSTVYPDDLVPLARPSTAVDLATDTLSWHVRESLVRYLAAGSKSPLTASGGATLGAPVVIDGAPPLPYDVSFVPSSGWFDPVSGAARLRFAGKVNLGYPGHGIDIDISDPIVEVSGKDSRVLATFGGSSATQYKGIGILATVNPAAVTPVTSGATTAYPSAPGAVPADSASTVFAGFYSAGNQFGAFTFSFTRGA